MSSSGICLRESRSQRGRNAGFSTLTENIGVLEHATFTGNSGDNSPSPVGTAGVTVKACQVFLIGTEPLESNNPVLPSPWPFSRRFPGCFGRPARVMIPECSVFCSSRLSRVSLVRAWFATAAKRRWTPGYASRPLPRQRLLRTSPTPQMGDVYRTCGRSRTFRRSPASASRSSPRPTGSGRGSTGNTAPEPG